MKVIQALRLNCVKVVSLGSGTFRQIADHVDKKMVARQAQRMSRVPRPSGEDVHPRNALLVLFVDILALDIANFRTQGAQWTSNATVGHTTDV
jgi:hypothetical protein